MPNPICTLVHISDPHFGSSFVIDGESSWRRIAARIPGIRHITASYPHGYQAAGALALAVRSIVRERKERGVPAVVIHTGDLTAGGTQAQFSVGETFLRHGHYLENGALAGLSLETEFGQLPFDIPGNHDIWHRRSPKDSGAFNSHYGGPYPRRREIKTESGRVLLYGLDSNRSSLWQHRLANGEIEWAALDSVCEALQQEKTSGAIQVVCLHHPLRLRNRSVPRLLRFEILKLKNRNAVSKALTAAGAHFVLAGHVHNQQHSNKPLHFIAGSACQISSRPSFWSLDLFTKKVEYTYFHLPKNAIHFVPAFSRSGEAFFEI